MAFRFALLLWLAAACPSLWAQGACGLVDLVPVAQRTVTAEGEAPRVEKVALPDHLPAAWRNQRHAFRYELDVGRCTREQGAALWLFRVGGPYRAFDDQGRPLELLSARDRHADVLSGRVAGVFNGRIPALFALPKGVHRVRVDLQALPYIPAGIVQARLGPTNALLAVQTSAVEDVVAYADAASGVLLVLGLLALVLWWQRRADATLLWLALACGLWGLRGVAYFNHGLFLQPLAFEQFNPLNVMLTSGALAASVLNLLGGMSARERWLLAGATVACTLALLVTMLLGTGAVVARAMSLATSVVMVSWLLVQIARKRRTLLRWHAATLAAGLGGLLFCAGHDMMVVAGRLGPDEPSYVFWGFVLLLIGFAAIAGQYVVATLNRAERSNEELELRIAQKSRELEHSYERLRHTEQDAARAQERARLLRDMHDGLGAQLMTALRGVERRALGPEQVAQSLQDGLDELRLLMDSTDMAHYLPGALAAWRNRWDARLAAAGVTLEWRIDESLDAIELPSDTTLQVMRILQEAATNIVKHAHAERMELHARVEGSGGDAALRIDIRDNGCGLVAQAARAGARGLKNMDYRARQVGAELVFETPEGGGTRVALRLPLAAPAEDQATSPRRAASIAASAREEMPSLR